MVSSLEHISYLQPEQIIWPIATCPRCKKFVWHLVEIQWRLSDCQQRQVNIGGTDCVSLRLKRNRLQVLSERLKFLLGKWPILIGHF